MNVMTWIDKLREGHRLLDEDGTVEADRWTLSVKHAGPSR
jgi:hypothetical protein